ncbi:uncharacterized protein TNCT_701311 [Trichonephila clavata]|uniref:Gustatory receptor n=1 Tax=Trichonephila clavata TaxID=2740835 RepID=A0A8X6GAL3_TRICU|nr:uncharacterized protein TNCT_701311 [Trichonephila clavata]
MFDFLLKILCLFGLTHNPSSCNKKGVAHFAFRALLWITYVDTILMYSISAFNVNFNSKIVVVNMICITTSAALVFIMTRQRETLTNLIKVLRVKNPLDQEKNLNFLIICLLCLPFTYAFTMVMFYAMSEQDFMFDFFTYGIAIEDKAMKYVIAYYKYLMYYFLYLTLPNLVTTTYVVSCRTCSESIQQLSLKGENCSPKAFTSRVQIGFMKDRKYIMKLVEEIQTVFSRASFFICMTNFMSCLSNLGQIIFYLTQNVAPTLIEILFISFSALTSMLSIFYYAGQIPIEMKRLTQVLKNKFEDRVLLGTDQDNSIVERLLIEENTFVMSGCDLIFFTRNGILPVLGTILTYGLLILSLDLKHKTQ